MVLLLNGQKDMASIIIEFVKFIFPWILMHDFHWLRLIVKSQGQNNALLLLQKKCKCFPISLSFK